MTISAYLPTSNALFYASNVNVNNFFGLLYSPLRHPSLHTVLHSLKGCGERNKNSSMLLHQTITLIIQITTVFNSPNTSKRRILDTLSSHSVAATHLPLSLASSTAALISSTVNFVSVILSYGEPPRHFDKISASLQILP